MATSATLVPIVPNTEGSNVTLSPELIEAIEDAAFMLENVEEAKRTPRWERQYEAMGRKLHKLVRELK